MWKSKVISASVQKLIMLGFLLKTRYAVAGGRRWLRTAALLVQGMHSSDHHTFHRVPARVPLAMLWMPPPVSAASAEQGPSHYCSDVLCKAGVRQTALPHCITEGTRNALPSLE